MLFVDSSSTCYCQVFNFSHSGGGGWVCHFGLICIFLIINDAESLFIYLLAN